MYDTPRREDTGVTCPRTCATDGVGRLAASS
jgi:hypothetical protein